ncbi:hypothetical protein GZ77_15725 [Endozoicomonas montiporae]|uniref:Uncharacterized protein n=2 Tax=Endozoicomonas montiporae TaxID=1027273 RepID=A0A081N5L8_9GAMM|nr:hypothetical protein [Endozoicomonas montiporae]AMO57362.1 hypothetical protein EZMO1_3371 [Endozoicomonas montiporae CL-33]KEQ13741.1 hypothetical protein GZ77_15725 [Endozoicomonas montiporae]
MRKEVLWGAGLAVGIGAIVTGLFLLPDDNKEAATELPAEAVVEETVMFQEPMGNEPVFPEGYDFDKDDSAGSVTRIVIQNGTEDSDEISSILSEKVIIDNQVVDKSAGIQ